MRPTPIIEFRDAVEEFAFRLGTPRLPSLRFAAIIRFLVRESRRTSKQQSGLKLVFRVQTKSTGPRWANWLFRCATLERMR